MPESSFLWPEARFLRKGLAGCTPATPARVEAVLSALFGPAAAPVVVSSGRAGLVLALDHLGLGRADSVGLFPFASHCVIESVGRVASPVSGEGALSVPSRIIYHQWGYVQERSASARSVEDAVDSFCLPGVTLFPAGTGFEVWSLPKLAGCLGGGVLWCRDPQAAAAIRGRRDQRRQLTTLRWTLRMLSASFPALVPLCYGAESAGGPPPVWAGGDLISALENWEAIGSARRERLAVVSDLLPSWLEVDERRLPTAVPIIASDRVGEALGKLGFSAGFRHFERIHQDGRRSLVKMFPIPVHQDVPIAALHAARRIVADAA